MSHFTILRTNLIDAIEALEQGSVGHYGVVLEIIGRCPEGSIEMTEVQSVLREMEVTPEKLWEWLGQYIHWLGSTHIRLAQYMNQGGRS